MNFKTYFSVFLENTIKQIKQDNYGKYKYLQDIKYKLGDITLVVPIHAIHHTQENTFYPDQIQRYKEYLQNGGIIETLPVEIIIDDIPTPKILKTMLEYLDESNNFDELYDLAKNKLRDYKQFSTLINDILYTDKYPANIKAQNISQVFTNDDNPNLDNASDLLNIIFNHFKNKKIEPNIEFYLTDFNHRLAALKEINKTSVLVEPITPESIKIIKDYPELFQEL